MCDFILSQSMSQRIICHSLFENREIISKIFWGRNFINLDAHECKYIFNINGLTLHRKSEFGAGNDVTFKSTVFQIGREKHNYCFVFWVCNRRKYFTMCTVRRCAMLSVQIFFYGTKKKKKQNLSLNGTHPTKLATGLLSAGYFLGYFCRVRLCGCVLPKVSGEWTSAWWAPWSCF